MRSIPGKIRTHHCRNCFGSNEKKHILIGVGPTDSARFIGESCWQKKLSGHSEYKEIKN